MGEQNFVKLNYYQIMIFLYKIGKLKEENIQIDDDEIVSIFSKNSLKEIEENIITYNGFLPSKILKNLKIYKISKTTYNYLVNLTSINPFNSKDYKFYKPIIEWLDEHPLILVEKELLEAQRINISENFNKKLKKK